MVRPGCADEGQARQSSLGATRIQAAGPAMFRLVRADVYRDAAGNHAALTLAAILCFRFLQSPGCLSAPHTPTASSRVLA